LITPVGVKALTAHERGSRLSSPPPAGSLARRLHGSEHDSPPPVRALVRREDDRAAALRALGAEVVIADLTNASDVARALEGVRRVYFGLGVADYYLEATAIMAAVARERGDLEVLVNMSQMTVSQMSLTSRSESKQQRLHWLAEKVLDWSGLPVVHIRPTIFLQSFLLMTVDSVKADGALRLPFGDGRTSPVDASDVADVVAAVLADPSPHKGKVYELTGPRAQSLHDLAAEYAKALGRPIRYVEVPFEPWQEELRRGGFPEPIHRSREFSPSLTGESRPRVREGAVRSLTTRPHTGP